jgi:cytochrome d ubiquinol oxidase subunit II
MMHLPIDYPTLRLIWWGLMGLLLIGFTLTDGFDLGVTALLPFVARSDGERRMVINTVGPTWEGNQVWLILGAGAIFAAWPFVYAVAFSGFYFAMFLVLGALILRPLGFKYRSKREDRRWRAAWDWALFLAGAVPAVVFGVAVGNVLQGLPFRLDGDLRATYEGSFLGLFSPFALLCGLLSAAMLVVHGAAWLTMKAEHGPVRERARLYGTVAAGLAIALFAGGLAFAAWGGLGFRLEGAAVPSGPSNPLRTLAAPSPGAWLDNFGLHPWMWIAPLLGFGGAALALFGIARGREAPAFAGSSASAIGIVATVGLSMFPFILPSTVDPRSSLTVWNASSSPLTLFIMLLATIVFLPIILAYTAWAFRVMWGRSTAAALAADPDLY